jgi:ketosteroid isomerase-like protein
MSAGNIEIVRRIYEFAARRDTEAVLALYDAEVEAGRVEVEACTGSSGGRVTFILDDAQQRRHYCNAVARPGLRRRSL